MTFISESNLAALIGTSTATVRCWAEKGKYKSSKDENNVRGFDMSDLLDIPEVSEMLNSRWVEELSVAAKRTYTSVELFAGAGGLALGMEKAGFKHVLLNEFDASACKTLRVNRPDWNVIEGDVKNIDFSPLRGKVDFLSGGFPCQAFSFAGKQGGFNDARGTLFFELARAVKEINPRVFMAENVKGLVSHDNGKTFKVICNIISELGYILVTPRVLKGIMYQVPQKRERLVLIAIRNDIAAKVSFHWPSPYRQILTLKDALYKSVIYESDVPESEGARYPEKKRQVLALVPQGGDWRDLPEAIAQEYMGGSWFLGGGKTGMARRLSLDEPSLTLTCSPAQKQTERCHPLENRPLTVREYARIQTFPDEWIFQGTISDKYKQIGNAVPVNLAWAVGRALIRLMNDIETFFPAEESDCREAVNQIMRRNNLLYRRCGDAMPEKTKQLDLAGYFDMYGDSPLIAASSVNEGLDEIPILIHGKPVFQSKNILIGLVKGKASVEFESCKSSVYITGRTFPSSIDILEQVYFMPYIKGKGVRDLYLIKQVRVGKYKDAEYRLVFDLEFIAQCFDDYKIIPLNILHTYAQSTVHKIRKM